jgi:hypothetical protein
MEIYLNQKQISGLSEFYSNLSILFLLQTFYIVGALIFVGMAILGYPTLREQSKKKKKK